VRPSGPAVCPGGRGTSTRWEAGRSSSPRRYVTGFEMMLFTFAVFLVFILVAVKEGDHDQTG
jgi:hypothetical protein